MAEYFGKGISVGSGFDLGANLPLDNRTIQASIADRDAMPTIQLVEGLIVYVKENKRVLMKMVLIEFEKLLQLELL